MNNLTGAIGQPISIPHIHFQFTPAKSTWTIQHLQYSLRLAYATTFHGCIDKTIIDSRSKVFAHGQLYTSISCVHNQNDTWVLCNEMEDPDPTHKHMTANVIYKDLLL